MWRIDDPQGKESAKIKYEIVQYTRGQGLDLGCGQDKTYDHFIGVDNGHHAEFGWTIKPDVNVKTCEKLPFATQSMDFVFSSHLLEHIEHYEKALKEWFRVIKPGGHLVLYLPDDKLYPKVGTEGANPDHKHNLNQKKMVDSMGLIPGWDLVVNELRDQDNGPGEKGNEYSFLQVYKKRTDKKRLESWRNERPKSAAVVRYGAFGDMLQASSVLPGLKEQGYHIVMYTTPKGHEILKTNPYIDEFHLQETDQVPNAELRDFWSVHAKKFNKFINLSESVETNILPTPRQSIYHWPHEMRHRLLNTNYMEVVHGIAQVPMPPNIKFYPTEDESRWAKKFRPTGTVILWALSGSAVHKTWPYLDTVLARLLITYPDVTIILTGDHLCQMLEVGWEDEPRVIGKSGQWSIRETLTFAKEQADIVIGPETGVLNAVSQESVKKIVFLSHSSEENLTKYWTNTTVLKAQNTPCYPCHQLHYGSEYCPLDEETGCSWCQMDISPESVFDAIMIRQAA